MKAGVASGGGAALPGMIFNARKWVDFTCTGGETRRVRAGRLECTMQNLVDSLVQRFPEQVTRPRPVLHCVSCAQSISACALGVLTCAPVCVALNDQQNRFFFSSRCFSMPHRSRTSELV